MSDDISRETEERDRFYDWWMRQPSHERHDHTGFWDDSRHWVFHETAVMDAWNTWRAATLGDPRDS